MAKLKIEPELPEVSPAQSLAGWRREFCIELLGDGAARIFVRAVEESSLKATELQRGILFLRLDPRFSELPECVQAHHHDFGRLVDTARRIQPSEDNLFATVEFDRSVWELVQQHVDRWARRHADIAGTAGADRAAEAGVRS